jgi:SAM-dependent methyltransferase
MTDWQNCYTTGNTPWDKGAHHPGMAEAYAKIRTAGIEITGSVLIPGCGSGHDALPWAEAGANRVLGLDIAPGAIEKCRQRPADSRITFELGDFFAIPGSPLAGQFDWVWEHTCFCAIPPEMRSAHAAAAQAALKPGGHLLAVFYLNPWDPEEDQTQGPPFGVTREALDSFFRGGFELVAAWTPARTYPGREAKEEYRLLRRRS